MLPATFDEVLQLKPIADGVQKAVNQHLSGMLLTQGANMAVQGVDLLANKGGLLVKFSGQNGAARLMMDGSGKIIPTLVDPKTGKILENARAAQGLKAMGKLANVAAIAVSIANIVSAYDQVKRLESIEKKMDFLIKARRWDQAAKLETIYFHAREILAHPEFGPDEKRELHGLCRELRELRITWRHELDAKLDQVKAEREGGGWSWFLDKFNKDSREQKHVASIHEAMGILDAETHLMDVSVALQTALAWAADKHDVLLTETLPAESLAWDRIRAKLSDKLKTLDQYKQAEAKQAGELLADRWDGMITRVQSGHRRAKSAFEAVDAPIDVTLAKKTARKKATVTDKKATAGKPRKAPVVKTVARVKAAKKVPSRVVPQV